ncbi:MAG: nitrate/nitrite transporter NrtS [Candidatus Dormibacteria bacterium]
MAPGSEPVSRTTARRSGTLWYASRPPILRRGVKVSLVVGTLLGLINEGPTVVAGHADLSLIPRAMLNYVVPFCVSCYSAAAWGRSRDPKGTRSGSDEDPGRSD